MAKFEASGIKKDILWRFDFFFLNENTCMASKTKDRSPASNIFQTNPLSY